MVHKRKSIQFNPTIPGKLEGYGLDNVESEYFLVKIDEKGRLITTKKLSEKGKGHLPVIMPDKTVIMWLTNIV